VLEAVRQVFIVVNGNRHTVLLEDVHALLDELASRIEHLSLLVPLVVAVFADHQHRIDRELAAAAPKRLRDRWIDLEVEFLRARGALVSFRLLIDVERDHFHIRLVPRSVARIADQESIAYVLRVREVSVDGRDDGYAFHR